MELDKELLESLTHVDHYMYVLALRRLAETIDAPDMVAFALAKEHFREGYEACSHCSSAAWNVPYDTWKLPEGELELVTAYCGLLKREVPIKGIKDPERINLLLEWAFEGPIGELVRGMFCRYAYRYELDHDEMGYNIFRWEGQFDWDVIWMSWSEYSRLLNETERKEE